MFYFIFSLGVDKPLVTSPGYRKVLWFAYDASSFSVSDRADFLQIEPLVIFVYFESLWKSAQNFKRVLETVKVVYGKCAALSFIQFIRSARSYFRPIFDVRFPWLDKSRGFSGISSLLAIVCR